MKLTLKQWRRLKDITQEELAEKIGVSATTIWAWENGTMPSGRNLQIVANALEVSADDIILPEN